MLEAESGISPDVIAERGYRTIQTKAELSRLGFAAYQCLTPGLLVPIYVVTGELGGYQFRPDTPRVKDGRAIKYETPAGSQPVLDVPRRVLPLLCDVAKPLWVAEGSKKADSAASVGLVCISVSGVYAWRDKQTALPDWEHVALRGRTVILGFDSDVMLKREVWQALARFQRWLEMRGAEVKVLYLPADRGKVGLDDYLALGHSVAELDRLVESGLRPLPKPAVPSADMAALLDDLARVIRQYVVLSGHQTVAVVLWIAHTHVLDAAEFTPYLDIHSATKRSGKTRLLRLLALYVARPWYTGRATAAVLVRKIAKYRSTLLLDETDSALRSSEEYAETLRGVLNNGFFKGGVHSMCAKSESDIELVDFAVFGAKAIAGIGKLPDTVRDRSIPILLRRKTTAEVVRRFHPRDAEPEADPLRQRLENWAVAAQDALVDAQPTVPEALDDRAKDIWEPLLAIADAAGGDWPQTARTAALALSGGLREDDDIGVRLLGDIATAWPLVGDVPAANQFSVQLCSSLNAMPESPWPTFGRGERQLTQKHFASLLSRFEIRSGTVHQGGASAKGYKVEQFHDAWERYGVLQTSERPLGLSMRRTGENQTSADTLPDVSKNGSASHDEANWTDGRLRTPKQKVVI